MNKVNWKLYQGALLPDAPPHYEIELSQKEIQYLMKKFKPYFIRYCNEWDRGSGEFWYVIKDEKEDLNKYKAKVRYQIKKGLKNCRVEKVDNKYIADNGYEVYQEAFKNYNTFLQPISKNKFQNSLINVEGDFFGVFYENDLIAYAQNFLQENVCNYSTIKLHPSFLKYYPSYALIYEMNRYYLNEKNFLYVSDGARSLSHQTKIQDFLIQKFKFRKAYCRLNVLYRKDIEMLVKILYPFRKRIYKSNNKILQKIAVVLKHEEIRKSYD